MYVRESGDDFEAGFIGMLGNERYLPKIKQQLLHQHNAMNSRRAVPRVLILYHALA